LAAIGRRAAVVVKAAEAAAAEAEAVAGTAARKADRSRTRYAPRVTERAALSRTATSGR